MNEHSRTTVSDSSSRAASPCPAVSKAGGALIGHAVPPRPFVLGLVVRNQGPHKPMISAFASAPDPSAAPSPTRASSGTGTGQRCGSSINGGTSSSRSSVPSPAAEPRTG